MSYKIGDTVLSKNDKRIMKITNIDGSKVECEWKEKDGVKKKVYEETELEKGGYGTHYGEDYGNT